MSAAEKELVTIAPDANALIARAIDAGADVTVLTSLYEFQQRIAGDMAKREYFDALAKFQATCPQIERTKKAGNFKYAPLDSIIRQLDGHPERFGFSFRFDEESQADGKKVRCIVTHTAGHTETSEVFVPYYVGNGKTNQAQDAGGASTYGRRYSFANAFGLVVDDDDDGQSAGPNHIQRVREQVIALRNNLDIVATLLAFFETGDVSIEDAAQAYARLSKHDLMALNLAPSHGGFFDTEERAYFKSNREFHELVTQARNETGWHDVPENQL